MKTLFKPLPFLGIIVVLLSLGAAPLAAIAQTLQLAQNQTSSSATAQGSGVVAGRLRFRLGTIRPTENRSSGITRGNCDALEASDHPSDNLIAVVPPLPPTSSAVAAISHAESSSTPVPVETTTQEKPELFVYIPHTNAETATVLVTNRDGSETLFEGTFAVPGDPAVVRIAFPAETPAMELEERYLWSVSLHCDPITSDRSADPLVEGWITRVQPNADLVDYLAQSSESAHPFIYARAGIWQDTLATLAELLLQNPEDAKLVQDWKSLLVSANLSELASVPLYTAEVEPTPTLSWDF